LPLRQGGATTKKLLVGMGVGMASGYGAECRRFFAAFFSKKAVLPF
jgi:hypothetical protein